MTQEDQDATLGRTIRELRQIREKLGALRTRAKELSDSFTTVAHHLRENPQFLRLNDEGTASRFVENFGQQPYGSDAPLPKKETLDINEVIAIRDQIRKLIVEEENCGKRLEAMGYMPTSESMNVTI